MTAPCRSDEGDSELEENYVRFRVEEELWPRCWLLDMLGQRAGREAKCVLGSLTLEQVAGSVVGKSTERAR